MIDRRDRLDRLASHTLTREQRWEAHLHILVFANIFATRENFYKAHGVQFRMVWRFPSNVSSLERPGKPMETSVIFLLVYG